MSNYCHNCKKKTNLFFCSECYSVLEYPSYIANDKNRESSFRKIIDSVLRNYEKAKSDANRVTGNTLLTGAVKNYYHKVKFLEEQCKDSAVRKLYKDTNGFLFPKMQELGERCLANECQVVLVGTMNAGKSCLINAILGRELASISMLPETASLTKFRHTQEDTIKATFYNQTEWAELWKSVSESSKSEIFQKEYENLKAQSFEKEWIGHKPIEYTVVSENDLKEKIKLYSSTSSALHYFVKELEIGLKDFNIPSNVVFVDTPGLNDPVSYRSEITKDYLKNANVVLLLIKAQALQFNETTIIEKLFQNMRYFNDRIYILGTQYDANGDAQNSWNDIKTDWIKTLSCKGFYDTTKEEVENKIIPIAPYFYTLLKRYALNNSFNSDFTKKDKNDLINGVNNILEYEEDVTFSFRMNNHFNELIDFSNIDFFRELLTDTLEKDTAKFIVEDIGDLYSELKKILVDSSLKIRKTQEDTVKVGQSTDLRKQIKEIENRIDLTKSTIEELNNQVRKMKNEIQNATKEVIKSIKY